jgi:hypothetical protein
MHNGISEKRMNSLLGSLPFEHITYLRLLIIFRKCMHTEFHQNSHCRLSMDVAITGYVQELYDDILPATE